MKTKLRCGERLHNNIPIPANAQVVTVNNRLCYLARISAVEINKWPWIRTVETYKDILTNEYFKKDGNQ